MRCRQCWVMSRKWEQKWQVYVSCVSSKRNLEKQFHNPAKQYQGTATVSLHIFAGSGIETEITSGQRYLGAVRGSQEFKAEYVKKQNSRMGKRATNSKRHGGTEGLVHPIRLSLTRSNTAEPSFYCDGPHTQRESDCDHERRYEGYVNPSSLKVRNVRSWEL